MFIITFFVPFQVLLIPTFLIIRDLDWIDTWPGLVLPIVAQTPASAFSSSGNSTLIFPTSCLRQPGWMAPIGG